MTGYARVLLSYVVHGVLAVAGVATVPVCQPVEVVQIPLTVSNVHLIKDGTRSFLIDSGSKGDLEALTAALAHAGVRLEDLSAVILTHGHADHAGLAAEIKRRSRAVLIAGRGDRAMLAAGVNEPVTPTSLTARLILMLPLDPRFEAVHADVEVKQELDLSPYGLAARAWSVPGHTPGSLVVLLDDGRAFVGDMILGGWFGGALFPQRPGEHYFHMDGPGNRTRLFDLAQRPIRQYFLGHGGPITREALRAYLGLPEPVPQGND